MAGEALAAGLLALAALWLILQPLVRPRPSTNRPYEAIDPEETPKGIALAALKEIEFDRETGKLSDSDYDFLKAKYTAAALEALRAEPRTGADDVEALIAARVHSLRSASSSTSLKTRSPGLATGASGSGPSCDSCGPRPEPDAVYCSSCGRNLAAATPCPRCGAALRPGSRFCEGCGRPVAA